MGLGIAQVFCTAGFAVLATDAQAAARNEAHGRLAGVLNRAKLSEEEANATLGRLIVVDGPGSMAPAELVVEAVAEDLGVKRVVFSALEEVLAPDAVLATNTSSLSVTALAQSLRHPERLIGLHFFNPAPMMRLVELIRHPGTRDEAAALALSAAERAGKTIVEAPDTPGFVVNRCARPFYGEALALLEEGRLPAEVDAAVLAAGFRMGPFSLIDLVGADINLASTRQLREAMGGHPRYHVFAALEAQVASGRLGRKSGKGFLFPDRPGPAPADADATALRIEATLVKRGGLAPVRGGCLCRRDRHAIEAGPELPARSL
jgi:3-hydroxybutyryl-CoA dehydrogenase